MVTGRRIEETELARLSAEGLLGCGSAGAIETAGCLADAGGPNSGTKCAEKLCSVNRLLVGREVE